LKLLREKQKFSANREICAFCKNNNNNNPEMNEESEKWLLFTYRVSILKKFRFFRSRLFICPIIKITGKN